MFRLQWISLFLLLAGTTGLRLPHVELESQYTGYDETNGWEDPKSNWNPPWDEDIMQDWRKAHDHDVEKLLLAAQHDCKVVLIGDSITEQLVRGAFNSGMPDPDSIIIRDNVRVFALGGDRFRDQGWRLFEGDGMHAIEACQPEKVFVMLGTNEYGNPPNNHYDEHGYNDDFGNSIQDLHNFVSQLREKLPESTQLIVHAVLPRLGNDTDPNDGFSPWNAFREEINKELRLAVANAHDPRKVTTYADCSFALRKDHAHYHDEVHLNTQGLAALGHCLENRYNMKMMEDSVNLDNYEDVQLINEVAQELPSLPNYLKSMASKRK